MVETSPLPKGTKRYDPSVVKNFLSTALIRVGVEPDDADLVGDVLVGADLRGVRSHGAARLSYFIVRLEKGTLNLHPNFATGLSLLKNCFFILFRFFNFIF